MTTGTVRKMSWNKGSKWRKWDLHVHSPASHGFTGDWNQFIIQLGNADCDVVGINDYFSVAGYREVLARLNGSAEGNKAYREALAKLEAKTLLPVVECRMNNVIIGKRGSGPRINFHIIFSPELNPADIETFIRGLKVSGSSIAARYDDPAFLKDSVSVDFSDVCQALHADGTFKGQFLIWMPYDEYGGIDDIDPKSDGLFKQDLIRRSDILGSSNRNQADFFLWRDKRYTEAQFRDWFEKRKPCIKGSDSHNVNDELGKLKDHASNPTDKYCWIKADPTFSGLKQIINEPEERVFIGRLPPKMAEVQRNSTQYLSELRIRKLAGADGADTWFNCTVPLNFDMVAIIGNKGSGKSALADILAIAGNCHCDPKYFSFLTKERFCERNGKIAKQFEVEAVWTDGSTTLVNLNDKPNLNAVEQIKYIPQTYLERICTETEPGQKSEFQRELRKVIFSHIPEADRLKRETLDDLIEYKTEELRAKLTGLREQMSGLNADILKLEAKASPEHIEKLDSKLRSKQSELKALDAQRPEAVEQPPAQEDGNDPNAAVRAALETERATLAGIDEQLAQFNAKNTALTAQLALAKKLEGRLDNFEADYKRLLNDCRADFKTLGLDVTDVVTINIDRQKLQTRRDVLESEKRLVDAALDIDAPESSVSKKHACEKRVKEHQEKLDAPNKRFQAYQGQLRTWQEQRKAIEGTAETADTVKHYEAQLAYIKTELPPEMTTAYQRREELARAIHATVAAIRDVYSELFSTVQRLIEESVIIKKGFKLTFNSGIVERSFAHTFFDTYINQGVAGSFCGKERGMTVLEELRAEREFNQADDAIAFVKSVLEHLSRDMRTPQKNVMGLPAQLRKHVQLQEVYDFLWSLSYLEPEYSLKFDGKDLAHLSPGERGTLLLVFYLLVDKSNMPIVVDQPEENLDNHTVYRLLIPVIKDVKKRRQIIMVTHSPNIAVVCDAEQIIHASIDRTKGNEVQYEMGAIESPKLNKHLVDVLEGTRDAFDNRGSKYTH